MNDWSFGQFCRLAGVAKETINRLRPETARQVFLETLPRSNKPLQLFTQGAVDSCFGENRCFTWCVCLPPIDNLAYYEHMYTTLAPP